MRCSVKSKLILVLLCVFVVSVTGQEWQKVSLPSEKAFTENEGFATYRAYVKIPRSWNDLTVMLWLDQTNEVDEGYFNGTRIGTNGSLDIFTKPASNIRRPYIIPEDLLRFGEYNLISIRCLSKKGPPAVIGTVTLLAGEEMISLAGQWEFRTGDDLSWHEFTLKGKEAFLKMSDKPAGYLGIQKDTKNILSETMKKTHALFNNNTHKNARVFGTPSPPSESMKKLTVKNLDINLAAHEPDVSQPIQVKFDEKGRMWVVQFRQYPEPAGLKTVGMDKYLRKVFDRKLPPPPYTGTKYKGADKITFHEDKDGNGTYESSNTFVDGLNITTALEFDKDGLWVLSPPHLLYYHDKNHDGKADSETPEVHLSGFNLEDTHAIANSLTLGPDGWLYGVTGSTTTGRVIVEKNPDHEVVSFFGQTVWRYHREKNIFELFTEGGYNNFGLDFDARGHLFSGTNGRTSILHFVQGGYFRKSLGKHGPHNNFYPYHLLDTVKDNTPKRSRLIHQWLPYLGASIDELRGKLVGPNSLGNLVDVFSIDKMQSTYESKFDYSLVTSTDKWFRPVHVTSGPDGAIYISDWYDSRITHLDPADNWNKTHGRVYRIQKKGHVKLKSQDLKNLSTVELIELFSHKDYWYRRTALRLFAQRKDKSCIQLLKSHLINDNSALESLWALYSLGDLDKSIFEICLTHENEAVREWSIRLMTDFENALIEQDLFNLLLSLTEKEDSPYVLSQLAASAKRMVANQSKQVLLRLMNKTAFADDPRIPVQVWWAMERIITKSPAHFSSMLETEEFVDSEIAVKHLSNFIGRRLISESGDQNISFIIKLLSSRNIKFNSNLLAGMKIGAEGRFYSLSESQIKALNKYITDSTLKARLFGKSYIKQMVSNLIQTDSLPKKMSLLKSIAYSENPLVLKEILSVFPKVGDKEKKVLLSMMSAYKSDAISTLLIRSYESYSDELKYSVIQLLAGRPNWSVSLLNAVNSGSIKESEIRNETKLVLQNSSDKKVIELVSKIWKASDSGIDKELSRVHALLKNAKGDSVKGKALFNAFCMSCHKLNASGGFIGPDLSGYELHNLSFIIPAVVKPNLAIREGFELTQVQLRSGVTLSGFIKEQNDSIVKIQNLDGSLSVLNRKDVLKETRMQKSMMPEGLTKALNDEQVRDLFEYLRSQSAAK